jgi:murein DD-endopeptidase MepM/ murein hydrolase activator NlpD
LRPTGRAKRYYTLLVLRDEGQITRLRVSSRTLRLLLIPLALLLALGMFLLVDYVRTKIEVARLEGAARPAATAAVPAPAAIGAQTPRAAQRPLTETELWRQIDLRASQLAPADRFFAAQRQESFALPERWPARGWALRDFGRRYNRATGDWVMNHGIDIAAPLGADVAAAASGTVLLAADDARVGKYIVLRHGHGLTTVYSHLEQALVMPGQLVRSGDAIARVGVAGEAEGPYLHYEVRLHNVPLDPHRYLP